MITEYDYAMAKRDLENGRKIREEFPEFHPMRNAQQVVYLYNLEQDRQESIKYAQNMIDLYESEFNKTLH